MSINDPIVLVCQPGHPLPYYLTRGRETFYDDDRNHVRFKTDFEAVEWSIENLNVSPHDHLPEVTMKRNKKRQQGWKDSERQLDLF